MLLAVRSTVNLTTVALLLILLVTAMATWTGRGPALVTSILTVVSLIYYFLPPLHQFAIGQPQNWVDFAVFVISALMVGELSTMLKKKAQEAEARRLQIEDLYRELQNAFEQASQAESLRRSEKLKTALLDAVTHDLRTPLTSIKASVTALLDEAKISNEADREFLQVIDEEADKLNHFIGEMMSLAQIEGQQLLIRRSPTSAEDVVNTAIARVDVRDRSLDVSIEETLPLLEVDAATISQALYEIVENASKYSTPGSTIRISVRKTEPGVAEFTVDNVGVTVPAEFREKVFEKFFRTPGSRAYQGFGMGLAIARGIVEAHGGRIWMESAHEGQGTTVRFTIPCREEQ